MQPDSPETRIGRLERTMAKLEQRVEDLISISLANFAQDIHDCSKAVKDLRDEVEAEKRELRNRETLQRQERKSDRRWMIGTIIASTSVIIAALAAVASVLS